ncbi:thioesterase [Histoplasma capsulatum]|uniref:Thioesterase n=1 Tax=Ajellomyces capsulatus TaxID=5037 RepID=A0A8A1M185_AJECA|nr:thioesterase [Histoplasma capsulatum]
MSSSSSSSSSSSTPTNPPAYAVPAQTLEYFQSDPWTSSFLSLATHTAIKTSSRTSDPSTGEDAFIAHTIGSPTTIPYCLTLRKKHLDTPPPKPPYTRFPPPATGPDAPKPTPIHSGKVDLFTLFALGTPGLNGHINTAHGGVVATLLDEVMSMAVSVHIPGYDENESVERARLYTAQLDVRYRKPVRAPGMAVVKAWCVARDGRKFFMRSQLVQEEEAGEGRGKGQLEWVKRKVVCAEAYGVWVQVREGKL